LICWCAIKKPLSHHFAVIRAVSHYHLLFVGRVDKKTFVNLIGAQYLGPAVSPGAVYVASVVESSTDILCIKGNACHARYGKTMLI